MRRTSAAYLPAALVTALMWLRLEEPMAGGGLALWVVLLAFLPSLARRRWTRALGYAGAVALAVGSLLEVSPLDPAKALERFGDGVVLFYDERVPIDPAEQPDMAAVALLAIFAFCSLLALAVAARRPVGAAAVLLVGAGWPATLVPGGGDLVRGALILAAALVLLAGLRRTPSRHALVAGAVVLAAAVGASTSAAVDRGAFLAWEKWDVYDGAPKPVGVQYVWDGRYAGVTFPERETTLLKIEAGPQRTYWRATTLEEFDGFRWREDRGHVIQPAAVTLDDRHELTFDPLVTRAAQSSVDWRRQVVTVEALRDNHLVGGSIPIAFDSVPAGIDYRWGGVAAFHDGRTVERGTTYVVWSYAPQPRARALARLGPDYPRAEIRRGRYLRTSSAQSVPQFGDPGRHEAILDDMRTGFLPAEYRQLYLTARRIVGDPPTPYGAVVALESWFRTNGGFAYDEQPGVRPGAPPLVDFLERKRGYCQHFAGAMALMLRYLGIPARVVVGFTSGDYDERTQTWKVTDHDAHAWVEAWFPRFGWLPFDPTPARGELAGGYTAASGGFRPSPDVLDALGGGVAAELLRRERLQGLRGEFPVSGGGGGAGSSFADNGRAALPAIVLGALLALVLLAVVKELRRRARYLRRDPRSLARGARDDVAAFLADQGFEVPPSATPAELARLVEQRYEIRADAFARTVADARYAPDGSRAARRARHEARDLVRRLRRRISWRARLRGLLSLRSLTT
jgi:transglutaminase-like putative cysteine protease